MPAYYHIDETLARRAKEMNSYHDYKPGTATASYRQEVDEATAIAETQKSRVDPMYHEKSTISWIPTPGSWRKTSTRATPSPSAVLPSGSLVLPISLCEGKKSKTRLPPPIWRNGSASKVSGIKSEAPEWAASAAMTAAPSRSSGRNLPSVRGNRSG